MPDWLIPIFTIIAGVLGPLVTVQAIMHRANKEKLDLIRMQVAHIDNCLDSLKLLVARATDHSTRITRLEDRMFRAEGHESRG